MSEVASRLGVSLPPDWRGVDAVWPLLERLRAERAVVLIKLDGLRGPGDNGPYTVVISGGGLEPGDALRTDADTVEDALALVILRYDERCWRGGRGA